MGKQLDGYITSSPCKDNLLVKIGFPGISFPLRSSLGIATLCVTCSKPIDLVAFSVLLPFFSLEEKDPTTFFDDTMSNFFIQSRTSTYAKAQISIFLESVRLLGRCCCLCTFCSSQFS